MKKRLHVDNLYCIFCGEAFVFFCEKNMINIVKHIHISQNRSYETLLMFRLLTHLVFYNNLDVMDRAIKSESHRKIILTILFIILSNN